jgi:hypothetical protein
MLEDSYSTRSREKFEDTKGVIRSRKSDNTMKKIEKTETMIYKALHRNIKIE